MHNCSYYRFCSKLNGFRVDSSFCITLPGHIDYRSARKTLPEKQGVSRQFELYVTVLINLDARTRIGPHIRAADMVPVTVSLTAPTNHNHLHICICTVNLISDRVLTDSTAFSYIWSACKLKHYLYFMDTSVTE